MIHKIYPPANSIHLLRYLLIDKESFMAKIQINEEVMMDYGCWKVLICGEGGEDGWLWITEQTSLLLDEFGTVVLCSTKHLFDSLLKLQKHNALKRKSQLCIPRKGIAASVPIPTFMCLWAIYIFPGSVHIFYYRRIGRPIEGIYK